MTRSASIALLLMLAACGTSSSSDEPSITGDACAVYTEAQTCQADSACTWYGTGCACPPNDSSCVCSPGTCASSDGSGDGSGSGSAQTGCACSDGGVCYQQLVGAAQTGSDSPPIECIDPSPGDGDPCARIVGHGICQDSETVSGLCICDDGD